MGRVIQVGEEAFKGDFELIPNGTKLRMSVYDIDVVPVKSGANAGKEQIDLTVKVTEEGPYRGREIRYNKLPLYDSKGAWSLVAFAEAVGWKTEKGQGVEVPDNVREVLGTEFIGKVGVGQPDQQGRVFNRVNGYQALKGGSTPAPAEEKAAKSWDEL